MKCEWPGCKSDAEHEAQLRGEDAPVNLCGAHRLEYLRDGKLPKEKHDVPAGKAKG